MNAFELLAIEWLFEIAESVYQFVNLTTNSVLKVSVNAFTIEGFLECKNLPLHSIIIEIVADVKENCSSLMARDEAKVHFAACDR